MLGIDANYYIVEAQFREGEDPYVEEEDESSSQQVSLIYLTGSIGKHQF